MLLLAFTGIIELLEQALGERADDGLLVVVDHILEELIDKLHLKVGQVEASVVVAIELVGEVEHDLVTLTLLGRRYELVNPPITQMLHLRMTRHEAVELELAGARCVQVRNAFVLVRNKHTLDNNKGSHNRSILITYLLVGECL